MLKLRTFAIVFALAVSPVLAAPKAVQQAKELLALWQPEAVSLKGSTLTLVLPERQLTEQIYLAVIETGICAGVLTGKPLPGVSSIEVLNQLSRQGYVYEAGIEDCTQINDLPVGDRIGTLLVLGETHVFSAFK
ncbi:hypothetical protein [Paracoccus sp. AS002]|uniref:hypothetical protein n=1 Tax=Paracoccus sp. AS002 TaxID=3019545 RepID=UPI0023E79279|nr:hypothetical protein [Paracoccus sp. AS002]MDF3906793.1 hypothetical protein [Paracoccus sp. AS002]